MAELEFVEAADPEDVFGVLADETRIAILEALWEAEAPALSFSALREAVGLRDSGQFNYHLNQLVGRFVTKTADGYALSQAGQQINGAIAAGAYTMTGSIDPIDIDPPCPTCGGARQLRYEDETVTVECGACEVGHQFGVPPGAFAGYDREAVPRVAGRYLETMIAHLNNDFCPFCDGRVTVTVGPAPEIASATPPDADVPPEIAEVPLIEYTCQQCGATPTAGLPLALLDHPAVVQFFHDRGVDVDAQSVWAFADVNPDRQTVRSRDPFRASVTYTTGEAAITLVVDDALTVVAVEDG